MATRAYISSFLGMSGKSLELEYFLDVYLDTQQNVDTFPLSVLQLLVVFHTKLPLLPFPVLAESVLVWLGNRDIQENCRLTASPNQSTPKVYRKSFHIYCLDKLYLER